MSNNSQKMKIGIIGCGNISGAYFGGARNTDVLEIKSCADLQMEAAQQRAEQFGCQAVTVDQLLSDPEIELIVNLTIPRAHVEVGLQVLENDVPIRVIETDFCGIGVDTPADLDRVIKHVTEQNAALKWSSESISFQLMVFPSLTSLFANLN